MLPHNTTQDLRGALLRALAVNEDLRRRNGDLLVKLQDVAPDVAARLVPLGDYPSRFTLIHDLVTVAIEHADEPRVPDDLREAARRVRDYMPDMQHERERRRQGTAPARAAALTARQQTQTRPEVSA